MSVKLTWDRDRLMLGRIQVAEVEEAGMMTGHKARWWLSGRDIHGTVTDGKNFKARNEIARKECWDATVRELAAVGVKVTP